MLTDDVTYIQAVMLQGLDGRERALRLGAALSTPLAYAGQASTDELDALRYWCTLAAYVLGLAENAVGVQGRDAIVQTLRNAQACTARTGVLQ